MLFVLQDDTVINTAITYAFLMVDNQCTTTTNVITIRSNTSWTTHVVTQHLEHLLLHPTAKSLRSLTIALAKATLCFCLTDNWTPLSPTIVLALQQWLLLSVSFEPLNYGCTFDQMPLKLPLVVHLQSHECRSTAETISVSEASPLFP